MKPPRNLQKYLAGKLPLPAGFVPLAHAATRLVGINADGYWTDFYKKIHAVVIAPRQVEYQRMVMALVVLTLGGTSAKAAKAIGVSPRTVESWRCGRKRLTVEKALVIARAMAEA